ncbi:MAG TPA: acyl-ACP--UDP-N-acetylglucosamine O-acyltransferase [Schlesneria sp.]
MSRLISPLAHVDPKAQLGSDVEIGPFCFVGPHVELGDGCVLHSNVVITGHTTIGERNRFFPGAVIGGEPQDFCYQGGPTRVEIGDDNLFREGVTVNRGADKEDGVTRLGNSNFLMSNAHVAHNCHVFNNTILTNGVLLGGHVHVHDYAIVSGNSAVHHFVTLGTGSFVGGMCRVVQDVPPYMLSASADNPEIVTINIVGMRRRGISDTAIACVRRAFKLLYREHKKLDEVRSIFITETDGILPFELLTVLNFVESSAKGKNGRGREAFRNQAPVAESGRHAA